MSQDGPPIIIKKIVKGGHGHHGGSWKVAYADFVTAMMALFIVLWVIGQDKPVKQSIAMYFTDPTLTSEEISIKLAQNAEKENEEPIPVKIEKDTAEKDDTKKNKLKLLAKKVKGALESVAWKQKLEGQIIIEMTEEGLRIELLDFAKSPFFHVGSSKPTQRTRTALLAISAQIKSVNNPIVLEGHTDGRPFKSRVRGYGNWELSTERANAARRLLEEGGIPPGRIQAVRGYAATQLRNEADPFDDRNRRISILIKVTEDDPIETTSALPKQTPKAKPSKKTKKPRLSGRSAAKTAHRESSAPAAVHH